MNPFREIWFNTDKCIDAALQFPEDKKLRYSLLIFIPGFAEGIRYAALYGWPLAVWFLISWPIITAVGLKYFIPWLIYRTGKLFPGKSSYEDIQLIVYLSCIPSLIILAFSVIEIIVPGDQVTKGQFLGIIVYVFFIRIMIIGIAKTQRLRYGFAFLNLLMPWILLAILYLVIRY